MELDGLLLKVTPPPAVTLTFRPNHYDRPRYIRGLILVKLAQIFSNILYSHGFQVIACCNLDFRSQKLISTFTNPNASVTKIGQNSLHWFLRYGVNKAFLGRTDSLTHRWTELNTVCLRHHFSTMVKALEGTWYSVY